MGLKEILPLEKSENIEKLAIALSKFQSEISSVSKNAEGYNYNYTNLDAILSAIQGPLHQNGLSISQFPINADNGGLGIITLLMHSSGQFLQSYFTSNISEKPDVGKNCQAHGSIITYYRRYALQSALNLSSTDDDGQEAKNTFSSSGNNNHSPKKYKEEPKKYKGEPKKQNNLLEKTKAMFTKNKNEGIDRPKRCSQEERDNVNETFFRLLKAYAIKLDGEGVNDPAERILKFCDVPTNDIQAGKDQLATLSVDRKLFLIQDLRQIV